MTVHPLNFAGLTAVAAALSMAATPAAALDMHVVAAPVGPHAKVLPVDAGEAHQYRHYRRHRDRGVDAGDVIAGVVVVGALAAILSSANNRDRDRDRDDERHERVRYGDPYDNTRDRGYDSRGIESAVDMCVDQVEYRNNRVENVDRADRSVSGWNVSGTLSDGEEWRCFIDNSGEVRSIDYGGNTYVAPGAAVSATDQLSDADYFRARANTRTAVDEGYTYDEAGLPDDPRPSYPGGPLPGEEGYDENWQGGGAIDDRRWEGDGRYTTAQAPDFEQR